MKIKNLMRAIKLFEFGEDTEIRFGFYDDLGRWHNIKKAELEKVRSYTKTGSPKSEFRVGIVLSDDLIEKI